MSSLEKWLLRSFTRFPFAWNTFSIPYFQSLCVFSSQVSLLLATYKKFLSFLIQTAALCLSIGVVLFFFSFVELGSICTACKLTEFPVFFFFNVIFNHSLRETFQEVDCWKALVGLCSEGLVNTDAVLLWWDSHWRSLYFDSLFTWPIWLSVETTLCSHDLVIGFGARSWQLSGYLWG